MTTCRCEAAAMWRRGAAVALVLAGVASCATAGPDGQGAGAAPDGQGAGAAPDGQGGIAVPSGQVVTMHEVIHDEAAGLLRLRFVAPRIARDASERIGAEQARADMKALCEAKALERMAAHGVQRTVISLSAAPVSFGAPAPDITQYFEAYRARNGACVWEAF